MSGKVAFEGLSSMTGKHCVGSVRWFSASLFTRGIIGHLYY